MIKFKYVVLLLFLSNLGVAGAKSTITISDYPAHATSVASLTPDKRQKFRASCLGPRRGSAHRRRC